MERAKIIQLVAFLTLVVLGHTAAVCFDEYGGKRDYLIKCYSNKGYLCYGPNGPNQFYGCGGKHNGKEWCYTQLARPGATPSPKGYWDYCDSQIIRNMSPAKRRGDRVKGFKTE